MEITEVRVFLKEGADKKLKAYATITFDNSFVVRNVKVIEGNKGLFVAMPSRKTRYACPKCNFKNDARSKFCNQCGSSLPQNQQTVMENDPQAEHRDIAHPINQEFRQYIQKTILEAYEAEKTQDKRPVRASSNYQESPVKHDVPASGNTDDFEGDIEL